MQQIFIDRLSFGYETPLLRDATAQLASGWTALVGENGSGKSTLLRLISASLSPDSGAIRGTQRQTVVLCPQLATECTLAIFELAGDTSNEAHTLRRRFGLSPFEKDATRTPAWSQLSAGQRKRWQLAAALHQKPSVLLLDEPTNHLDRDTRDLLVGLLLDLEVIGILVSHDREFLDQIVSAVMWLGGGELTVHDGNYSQALQQRSAERLQRVTRKQALKREQARVLRTKTDRKQRALGAEKQRNTGRRMKSSADSDARGIMAGNRAERAGKRLAQDVSSLDTRLNRIDDQLDELVIDKEMGRNLFAYYEPSPKAQLLHFAEPTLVAGEHVLAEHVSLSLSRNDKVWIRGSNGAGKSTLLRQLHARLRANQSDCLFLEQDLSPDSIAQLRDQLHALSREQQGQVLSFVAAQGTRPQALLGSSAWSPGEAKKFSLGLGLSRSVSLLMLDEPTNHLDLPSIDRLSALLMHFPGALLLISHDEVLARAVCTSSWSFAERAVVVESL